MDYRTIAIYKAVGQRLAQARKEHGLTQQQLAYQTFGRLSRSAIANMERGRQRTALHHLFDVADALGIVPGELLPDPEAIPPLVIHAEEEFKARLFEPAASALARHLNKGGQHEDC